MQFRSVVAAAISILAGLGLGVEEAMKNTHEKVSLPIVQALAKGLFTKHTG